MPAALPRPVLALPPNHASQTVLAFLLVSARTGYGVAL